MRRKMRSNGIVGRMEKKREKDRIGRGVEGGGD